MIPQPVKCRENIVFSVSDKTSIVSFETAERGTKETVTSLSKLKTGDIISVKTDGAEKATPFAERITFIQTETDEETFSYKEIAEKFGLATQWKNSTDIESLYTLDNAFDAVMIAVQTYSNDEYGFYASVAYDKDYGMWEVILTPDEEATRPAPTGSDTAANTTGVLLSSVADCIAMATGVATPTMRSTLSAAKFAMI